MKRNQHLVLALASLIALGAASPACAGLFTGEFAPGGWVLDGYNMGTGVFNDSSTVLKMTGTSQNTSSSTTWMILEYSGLKDTSVDFQWALAPNGIPEHTTVTAALYRMNVDDHTYDLSAAFGSLSGVSVPVGSTLMFELVTTWDGSTSKGPSTLTITGVPEAGTWLAGVFALGIIAWEVLRRQRRVLAAPAQT